MKAHVEIGGGELMALQGAVLVYGSKGRAFCSWHGATGQAGQADILGPAQSLTTDFVRRLAGELGLRTAMEVLPGNVLVRTEELLVWWTPPACRTMFFRDTDETMSALSGRQFPQPPLVWAVNGHSLRVRALAANERPTESTDLFIAPYYHTDGGDGQVCQGSMRSPEEKGVAAIGQWERAFFQSEFTHHTGARKLTSHPGGFSGLWKSLAGKKRFPVAHLIPAKETLLAFANRAVK